MESVWKSYQFSFSSPTNSSRISDLKPDTLTRRERGKLAPIAGRRAPFCSFPFSLFLAFFFFNEWIPMKRRPVTTPIDGHAQGYFTELCAQPLTLSILSWLYIKSPPSLWFTCTHNYTQNYVTVSSQMLGSQHGTFSCKKNKKSYASENKDLLRQEATYLQGSTRNRLGNLLHLFLNCLEADKNQKQAIKTTTGTKGKHDQV